VQQAVEDSLVEGIGWVQRVVEDRLEVEGIEVRLQRNLIPRDIPFLQGNSIQGNRIRRRVGRVGWL